MNSNLVHPIYDSSRFTITTPSMEELQKKILAWVQSSATGGFVIGPYRAGKTKAAKAVSECITNAFGERIFAVRMTVPQRDRKTIANIFRVLCKSLEVITKEKALADDMSDLAVNRLCELASLNSTRQIVLFVDEMHRLDIDQFEAFAELHDLITEAEFNSCIVFIGNAETSRSLLNQIKRKKYELIRGRFFTRRYDFQGISNVGNLKSCLSQFDSKTTTDGTSLTQYFVKDSLGKDWMLESIAQEVWNIFVEEFKKPLKLKAWAMEYFISTVRILLSEHLPLYEIGDGEQLEEMISDSIRASGIEPCLLDVNAY